MMGRRVSIFFLIRNRFKILEEIFSFIQADHSCRELIQSYLGLVGEQLLGKLTSLVQEYGTQLQEIETALDESLSEVWDFASDPISLYLQAYEQTNILQLVRSDNKVFNKVITVFGSLCVEIQTLKELVSSLWLLLCWEGAFIPSLVRGSLEEDLS